MLGNSELPKEFLDYPESIQLTKTSVAIMLHLLLVLIALLSIWYIKSYQHHKKFPPGPRWPLPFAGDAYLLGKDLHGGLDKITEKYGRISGMWLGHQRAILVADFDILQDLLNKNEASHRQSLDALSK